MTEIKKEEMKVNRALRGLSINENWAVKNRTKEELERLAELAEEVYFHSCFHSERDDLEEYSIISKNETGWVNEPAKDALILTGRNFIYEMQALMSLHFVDEFPLCLYSELASEEDVHNLMKFMEKHEITKFELYQAIRGGEKFLFSESMAKIDDLWKTRKDKND